MIAVPPDTTEAEPDGVRLLPRRSPPQRPDSASSLGDYAFVGPDGHVEVVGSLLEARAAQERAGLGVVSRLTPDDLAVLARDGERALAHRIRTRPSILRRRRLR